MENNSVKEIDGNVDLIKVFVYLGGSIVKSLSLTVCFVWSWRFLLL